MEEPSQFSLVQTAQSLAYSIMEKPHQGWMNVRESYMCALEQGTLNDSPPDLSPNLQIKMLRHKLRSEMGLLNTLQFGLNNKSGRILFLGLDFAGKTTLLHLLKTGKFTASAPTQYGSSEVGSPRVWWDLIAHDSRNLGSIQVQESVKLSHFGSQFVFQHFDLQIEMQSGPQMMSFPF